MKNTLNYLLILFIGGLFFTACDSDDDGLDPILEDNVTGLYFINYGGGSVGVGSITKYDYNKDTVINNYYEAKNGFELTSKLQYGYEYNNKVYLMGNGIDQIIVLDTGFVQSVQGVTEDIHNPRYCVGNGDYLYVSCWGATPDWKVMPDSYIAKFNVKNNTVEDTILIPGGPEGLAIANGNLYAALNFKDSIAVIGLGDDDVSYVATPAVASYFVKDNSDNLYVSLVSTYNDPSASTGLGYINTGLNTLDTIYDLEGLSSDYRQILDAKDDLSVIYVLAYSWGKPSTIYTFDTATKKYTPLIENVVGIKGMNYHAKTNCLYVHNAESYSEPGTIDIYRPDGTYVSQFDCGVSPYWTLDLDFE